MTTKEATPKMGVSKRESDMEDLLQRRESEEGHDEEILDSGEANVEEIVDPEIDKEVDVAEDLLIFTTDKGDEYKVPKSASTKLKINGEEVVTPADKIVSRYQKGAAGDQKLQTANDLKKQLDLREADLSSREQNFFDQVEKAKQQNLDGDLSQDDYAEKVKQLVTAVVDADEDAAVELFSSIYKPPAQTGAIDEVALTNKFVKLLDDREEAKVAKAYTAELSKAQTRFATDYSELYKDERLYALVDGETAKIAEAKPMATPWEIISEAAENIKKWQGVKTDPGRKPKKKTPTPAGGKVPLGEDPKEETRADIINSIRVARGQPAL